MSNAPNQGARERHWESNTNCASRAPLHWVVGRAKGTDGIEMKAYRLSEYEAFAANRLEEAIQAEIALTGCDREDVIDGTEGELSEAELRAITVLGDDGQPVSSGWDLLQAHIASGKPAGFLFGSES